MSAIQLTLLVLVYSSVTSLVQLHPRVYAAESDLVVKRSVDEDSNQEVSEAQRSVIQLNMEVLRALVQAEVTTQINKLSKQLATDLSNQPKSSLNKKIKSQLRKMSRKLEQKLVPINSTIVQLHTKINKIAEIEVKSAQLNSSIIQMDTRHSQLQSSVNELNAKLQKLDTESVARDTALRDLLKTKLESIDRRLLDLANTVDEQLTDLIANTNSTDRRMEMLKNRFEEQHHDVNDVINSTDRRIKTLNSRIEEQQHSVNDVIGSTDTRMKALTSRIDEQQRNVNYATNSVDRRLQELQRELNQQQTELNDLTHSSDSGMQELRSRTEEQQNDLNDVICSSSQSHNTLTSLISRATPQSCSEIRRMSADSGVYTLYPTNSRSVIRTWCNMSSSGQAWTVVQRRKDGSVDFARDWAEYERGFGDPQGEFWLGLTAIHTLTSAQPSSLRVDLWDFEGGHKFAEWSSVNVGGADTNYKLQINGYSGNAGDSLAYHNSRPFTTRDRDNDMLGGNCATIRGGGGWWYGNCGLSNLNGRYREGGVNDAQGVQWLHWPGHPTIYSFRATAMMVRPQN